MTPFYVPTKSAKDWRRGLAKGKKHWRKGYSARTLALCWEQAQGLPPEIERLLTRSSCPSFEQVEMLVGLAEHKVPLAARGHASQNDLFVLAQDATGALISLMVEGKVSEPFGPRLDRWLVDASNDKLIRLAFLQETLGLDGDLPGHIRYQLLHRTASAVIEARRFNAASAVMIVHSFSPTDEWFDDYARFVELLGGIDAGKSLVLLREVEGIQLFAGWATGDPGFLDL